MNANQETKESVAAGIFATLLMMAFGGAGLIVAALAVGFERAWTGRAGRTGRAGWREWYADQLAWRDMDRQRRAAWRQERRDWYAAGADPAKRPKDPGAGFGQWARRAWAAVAVGAVNVATAMGRFADGCRAGYRAAKEAARNAPAQDTDADTAPVAGAWKRAWETVKQAWRRFRKAAGARPDTTPDQAPAATDQPDPVPNSQPTPAPSSAPTPEGQPAESSTPDPADQPQPPQEDQMTAPTQSTAPATGETNLDVTAQRLEEIRATLAQVTDQADALAAQKTQLEAQIRAASDHATSTGGTAATQQALDAAQAVVDQLGQHVGNVSQSAVEAGDTTAAAHAGLAPARDAQDMLHAAGATGEHVSAASGATS